MFHIVCCDARSGARDLSEESAFSSDVISKAVCTEPSVGREYDASIENGTI